MTDPPKRKLDFEDLEWHPASPGIRFKAFQQNGTQVRLLELKKGLEHPNWCETGHIGYVVKGELEIEFSNKAIKYSEGDGMFILSGEKERHIPRPITDKVILFMVEET